MICDGCGATTPTTAGWVHIGPVSDSLPVAPVLGDFCPACVAEIRAALHPKALGAAGWGYPRETREDVPLDTYRPPVL